MIEWFGALFNVVMNAMAQCDNGYDETSDPEGGSALHIRIPT